MIIQIRSKLQPVYTKVRAFYARHQSLHLGLGVLLFTLAVILSSTGAGTYLNRFFFYTPVAKIRANNNMLSTSDSRIGMILLEDRSLKEMGRHPTFADWQHIAKLLFREGVEKVFYLGESDLDGELGALKEKHQQGEFIVSAVNIESLSNSRAIAADSIPATLLGDSKDNSHERLPAAKRIIGPHKEIYDVIDHIGHINLHDDDTFDVAYHTKDNSIMLNFPLYILDNISWRDSSLWYGGNRIPTSPNQTLMYEFVEPTSAFKNALPLRVFFDPETKKVRPELEPGARQRLQGKKYVLLVKEAYQGMRFIDSPFGKVPSYLATVSVINSVLKNQFLYHPLHDAYLVLLSVPLILWLVAHANPVIGLGASAVFAISQLLLCVGLLFSKGWVLPSASIFILTTVGWVVRLGHYALRTLSDKLLLSKDLAMGQAVQTLFLPDKLEGKIGPWHYQFIFRPYGPMSGDWIQVFESPKDAPIPFAVVAIGDVIGKGPSAALNTAVIASIWNQFAKQWPQGDQSSEAFVQTLHEIIFSTFKSSQNTTLSLAYLAPDHATIFSCGAPPWLRINPGGKAATVRIAPADPLGLELDHSLIKATHLELSDGEIIMAHTDGVIDSGKSRKRFLKQMSELQPADTGSLFQAISNQAKEVGKGDVLPDDFTMVMIRKSPGFSDGLNREDQGSENSNVA